MGICVGRPPSDVIAIGSASASIPSGSAATAKVSVDVVLRQPASIASAVAAAAVNECERRSHPGPTRLSPLGGKRGPTVVTTMPSPMTLRTSRADDMPDVGDTEKGNLLRIPSATESLSSSTQTSISTVQKINVSGCVGALESGGNLLESRRSTPSPRYSSSSSTSGGLGSTTSASSSRRASRSQSTTSAVTAESSLSPSASKKPLKGILKSPSASPHNFHQTLSNPSHVGGLGTTSSGVGSHSSRPGVLETAKESALNFLVPSRKLTARKRALKRMYKWWETEIELETNSRTHHRIVTFKSPPIRSMYASSADGGGASTFKFKVMVSSEDGHLTDLEDNCGGNVDGDETPPILSPVAPLPPMVPEWTSSTSVTETRDTTEKPKTLLGRRRWRLLNTAMTMKLLLVDELDRKKVSLQRASSDPELYAEQREHLATLTTAGDASPAILSPASDVVASAVAGDVLVLRRASSDFSAGGNSRRDSVV